jgi:hypothetical protein
MPSAHPEKFKEPSMVFDASLQRTSEEEDEFSFSLLVLVSVLAHRSALYHPCEMTRQ